MHTLTHHVFASVYVNLLCVRGGHEFEELAEVLPVEVGRVGVANTSVAATLSARRLDRLHEALVFAWRT
jgi:hypothetical protein